MKPVKLFAFIASKVAAIANCEQNNSNEWLNKHTEDLERVISNYLPSGSGIDNGTQLLIDECSDNKLVFSCGYHHMNDVGYYTNWTEHKIKVTPSFIGDIDIKITGKNYNDIKDYLFDVFYIVLTTEIKER